MKNYTRYLQLLQDFQFRLVNPLLNIEPNDNYRFGDIEELNPLKKPIIAELKIAFPGTVKLKLKKLKEINAQFINFDKDYPHLYEKSEDGMLKFSDLIKSLPLINNEPSGVSLTSSYVKNLYQSILFRQKSLLDLINQTEDLMAGIT